MTAVQFVTSAFLAVVLFGTALHRGISCAHCTALLTLLNLPATAIVVEQHWSPRQNSKLIIV